MQGLQLFLRAIKNVPRHHFMSGHKLELFNIHHDKLSAESGDTAPHSADL
jgi:hypothetical protein